MECPGRYYRGWYWCSAATTRAHVTVLLLRLRAATILSPEVVREAEGLGESRVGLCGWLAGCTVRAGRGGRVCRSMLPGAEDRPKSCEVGALGLTHGKRPSRKEGKASDDDHAIVRGEALRSNVSDRDHWPNQRVD